MSVIKQQTPCGLPPPQALKPSSNFSAGSTFSNQNPISHTKASKEHTAMKTVVSLPAIVVTQTQIEDLLLANYVWRGQRYVHVDNPNTKLNQQGLSISARKLLQRAYPGSKIDPELVKKAVQAVGDPEGEDLQRILSVWSEAYVCRPGDSRRILPNATGTIDLNTWAAPAYRRLDVKADPGVFLTFLHWIIPDQIQRRMVLDLFSWSLQNEHDRPRWGLMLYSPEKGTGKSTFAMTCRALFGGENSIALNGVSKLTQKFSATALTRKFVNCEEVDIQPNSRQVNDLKAIFTDDQIALERKGFETEQVDLHGVYLFTSNHMPTFLKGLDRRLYVVQVSHGGHASGPDAVEFGELNDRVKVALKDEHQLAGLYRWLMTRPLSPGFNPNSLNTATQATPIMRQILGCDDANKQLLSEFLGELKAITLETLQNFARRSLRLTTGAAQAMMLELGWKQQKAKWGGVGYSRSIWVHSDYVAEDGKLHGPDGFEDSLSVHLGRVPLT